jgi:hypothetical protein
MLKNTVSPEAEMFDPLAREGRRHQNLGVV